MLSGSTCGLDKDVFVKALNELLFRLPLSLQSASDRLHSNQAHPSSVQTVYDYSLTSCNLLFGSLVANFKVIRSSHDFNACWLRFLSVLAANGSMLVRGSPVHNEVLDVLSALLRVLRVPKTFAAISKRHAQQPQEAGGKDMSAGDAQPAGGWLAWWTGAAPTQPTAGTPTVPATTQPSSPHVSTEPEETVSVSSGEEEDADLLAISWRTVCSIYTSFPAHLRIKYPTLVLEIAQFVEWRDRGSSKPPLPPSNPDSAAASEHKLDRPVLGGAVKEFVSDPSSPSSSLTPSSSRVQIV